MSVTSKPMQDINIAQQNNIIDIDPSLQTNRKPQINTKNGI